MLTVVMALSLVVVAGATDDVPGTVNLEVTTAEGAEPENGVTTELVYYVYLKPQGDAEVGVAQFTLTAPAGTEFKSVDFNYQKYVYNDSGVGIGSGDGIFAKDAITNVKGGDLGGHFEDGGMTFKAALAGTVRKDTVVEGETVSKRMLTSSNCNEWLYKLTVTLDTPYNENNSYVVGIDKSSLKAGYNRNVNEPTTTTDITLQHTIEISSVGYGTAVIVAPQKGLEDAYTIEGKTVKVTHTAPCRVGYLEDGKYKAITPTQNGAAYDFEVPDNATDVILVLKGDANGDGKVSAADATLIKAVRLKKASLDTVQELSADANGDGKVSAADATLIKAVRLRKANIVWDN